jgi:hypothetical protein
MSLSERSESQVQTDSGERSVTHQKTSAAAAVVSVTSAAKPAERFQLQRHISSKELFSGKYTFGPSKSTALNAAIKSTPAYTHEQRVSGELKSAVESIAYIAEHMKAEMSDKKIRDDWKVSPVKVAPPPPGLPCNECIRV